MDEKGERNTSIADVCFEDIQEIQVVQDKCQQLSHVFNLNRTVLQDMEDRLDILPFVQAAKDVADFEFIHSLVLEANIQISRIESLLKRLDGTIALVRKSILQSFYIFLTAQPRFERH